MRRYKVLLGMCIGLPVPVFQSGGCFKVGPNYAGSPVSVSKNWLEAADRRVTTQGEVHRAWWQTFNDPVLNRLIETAYRQNLSLGQAGVRVLEARARLGIAIGEWYPQQQQAFGSLQRVRLSASSLGTAAGSGAFSQSLAQSAVGGAVSGFTNGLLNPGAAVGTGTGGTAGTGLASRTLGAGGRGTGQSAAQRPQLEFSQANLGLTASWELDFWGRFRRGIESADAALKASLADYDSALVSLTADVAGAYILIRTLERRLVIARENVRTQRESLQIAEARFKGGTTSERDVQQARTQLFATEAAIPLLESQLRQTKNGLSILLGIPPSPLADFLREPADIPAPPPQVAVGIPADLLRRRPDVRSAELQAVAQSAQIGVAAADLLPAFSLTGTFGFQSNTLGNSSLGDTFDRQNRFGSGGTGLQWNFLNYGRIINNVRLQDARFQELILNYQNTVLTAQREVEDALAAFLLNQERAQLLGEGTRAAKRSLDLAVIQYRQGTTDFTTVLTAQQALLSEQDNLADTLGNISRNLVEVYRALGGGWQLREGSDVVSEETKQEMARRTCWGNLLKTENHIPCEPVKADLLPPPPDW